MILMMTLIIIMNIFDEIFISNKDINEIFSKLTRKAISQINSREDPYFKWHLIIKTLR